MTNVIELAKLVGNPINKFHTIHVTGTNGKGSVCWKIYKSLMNSGYKTGLFTSPHISCYRERVRINDEYISEDYIVDNLDQLFKLSENNHIRTSFFEYTTILGYKYFMDMNVDVAVIEVGLGGRLDATNIITSDLSCITSVALEHTKILGNKLEDIAYEKSGIIKPNKPVVLGKDLPFDYISNIAKKQNSPIYSIDKNIKYNNFNEINTAISKKCLEVLSKDNYYNKVTPQSIEYGINQQLSNRMEYIKTNITGNERNVILDCGHNPQAIDNLFKSIPKKKLNNSPHIILGFSNDKDIKKCLEIILKYIPYSNIHFVKSNNYRSTSQHDLYKILKELKQNEIINESNLSLKDTIYDTFEKMSKNDYCIICGSMYLLSEIREILNILDIKDPLII